MSSTSPAPHSARACPVKITQPRACQGQLIISAGTEFKCPHQAGGRPSTLDQVNPGLPALAVMLQTIAEMIASHLARCSLQGLPPTLRLEPNLNRSPGQNMGQHSCPSPVTLEEGQHLQRQDYCSFQWPKSHGGQDLYPMYRMTVPTSVKTPDTRGWRQAIARKLLCDSRQTPHLWSSYTHG